MREKGPHENERLNAYFDLIRSTDGKATNEELELAAKRSENVYIQKIGDRSEKKFMEFAKRVDNVKSVFISSYEDDVFNSIDMWVKFNDSLGLPNLPVQVKSSIRGVRDFRNENKYIKIKGLEIVINCGPSVTLANFNQQMREEVARIKNSLQSNPSLYQQLPKR